MAAPPDYRHPTAPDTPPLSQGCVDNCVPQSAVVMGMSDGGAGCLRIIADLSLSEAMSYTRVERTIVQEGTTGTIHHRMWRFAAGVQPFQRQSFIRPPQRFQSSPEQFQRLTTAGYEFIVHWVMNELHMDVEAGDENAGQSGGMYAEI